MNVLNLENVLIVFKKNFVVKKKGLKQEDH